MSGKIQVNNLSNANIYINGNSLLGRADEFKLPTVKFKMADHKAVGMIGTIKLPSGIEALEGEIKWTSFYPEVWCKLLDPFSAVQLQARGNLETHTSQGRIDQKPYVIYLTASFYEVPMGDFKQNEKAEFTSKFYATYIKQQVGGRDVLEVDAMANIYKVNGVDKLDQYRLHIGG
ncbi:phage major tail tube protein [Herbaspirillum seropedicae]|uniref:Bacteriophage tail core protein n=1 Tax=Herbaspirillum seropedicae (strain SmR1) TaxID=757424 RepID=D8IV26_HERSS|nr:phage major tail tube protein [Herbaspirillum seropedicae]ADJ61745.1 bacteriophage tail core protein [Herbaspirillum seropedicae SmR1]AKN63945.1 tail protein [Herbaspirillum seropedicae]NQE29317.1 tail protein [Herbaspirillum seropedicae]UMU19857.1 phage major tail tube protein [Herbaspirillum seropedicae]